MTVLLTLAFVVSGALLMLAAYVRGRGDGAAHMRRVIEAEEARRARPWPLGDGPYRSPGTIVRPSSPYPPAPPDPRPAPSAPSPLTFGREIPQPEPGEVRS